MTLRKLSPFGDDSVALRRIEQTLAIFYSGKLLWKAGSERYQAYRSATSFTVTIMGDDDIYGELQKWLLSFLPSGKQRSLVLYSVGARSSNEPSPAADGPPLKGNDAKIELHYDGSRLQTITLDGHEIQIQVLVPEFHKNKPPEPHIFRRSQRVLLSARSQEGRDAIVRLCEALVDKKRKEERQPRIYTPSTWGEWNNHHDLGLRSIDSVILKDGQTERLINDLEWFLASESRYTRFSLPYHRGYLFYGPPGTGKTSIAKALANHFGLDLYVMSPSEMKKDSNLSTMVGNITARSILLLEDLDSFHSATNREDNGGITMSGLLNALDGVSTPHGLITIMTTNNVEVLDPALTRPGRVDIHEEISHVDARQVGKLYQFFYGRPLPFLFDPRAGLTPAEVVELFKQNMDDPEAATAALQSLRKMPIATP